jgi:hypothetical protein
MRRSIAIFDTSLLCCWLNIPGREQAGSERDFWDSERVNLLLEDELQKGSMIVLPLATIIETGNHISQAPRERFEYATAFSIHIKRAALSTSPWAAFTDQSVLWTPEHMLLLAKDWPALAASKMSLGDATIKYVADYYSEAGFDVRILTSDEALRAYEPKRPKAKPRRLL